MMFYANGTPIQVDENMLENLLKCDPRKERTVRAHGRRMIRIQKLIYERFGVKRYRQWKAKHVRWVMKDGLGDISPATAYDYWRTCRWILEVIGVYEDWEPHLRGPWLNPKGELRPAGRGGRPPKRP